ncbi:hypothetical protein M3P05_17345 [Sansalvadorimonas sp. 2012CJ34-2]|uniref:Uncharacterized protein n=1 Tax=Parendozoicomonas callyspongiae TaxID=2942213 RepID=A0ABT0PK86_9GAMM|nr:hypothetical protein [Sansalvadorimonas sp. 2012CJ34-2]MCL6271686.1 hypothetical protein [Sansalvadorimonas sp. 2012CJ34-2]
MSKQQDVEGSERGLIVSLLCDHLLLQHPEQIALLENKQPEMPAGCLIERLKTESLLETVTGSSELCSKSLPGVQASIWQRARSRMPGNRSIFGISRQGSMLLNRSGLKYQLLKTALSSDRDKIKPKRIV